MVLYMYCKNGSELSLQRKTVYFTELSALGFLLQPMLKSSKQIQIVGLLGVRGNRRSSREDRRIDPKEAVSQGGGSSSDSGATATSSYRHGLSRWSTVQHRTAQVGRPSYGHRGVHAGREPPGLSAGYVCHRCRVPGHFIEHCPTNGNGDPRFDIWRVAPAPASSSAPPASGESDGVIPAELYCKICRNVMADAVVTSKCCFDSFCDGCIRDHIASKSKCACGAQARADDLIPNTTLRTTIANLLATTTGAAASASSGTDKTRSSAGSNAAHPAAPLSPAASQASRSSNVSSEKAEHSDGGASTSKKIATISGALGPRKAQETVAGDHSAESGARAVHGGDHYGVPFCPATGYVDPFFFGGMPFGADPYMYYGGVPYGCGGAPNGYYGGEELRDRKRARVSPGTGCW
ncbi:LOW QUALITY PROTEIN: E3 ubiquitin ligase PARAQUAT TOLERANCE 3 [Oryza sativa Japonica Group]|uniref:LOW QUALITY PROTEIN: E3 ubiquitin ligase PARAQUAT TOLERANCE 3 n=1 Tax=Oryza sativa subsp. japonica TaxID=39947 RepID=UPI00339C32DF